MLMIQSYVRRSGMSTGAELTRTLRVPVTLSRVALRHVRPYLMGMNKNIPPIRKSDTQYVSLAAFCGQPTPNPAHPDCPHCGRTSLQGRPTCSADCPRYIGARPRRRRHGDLVSILHASGVY